MASSEKNPREGFPTNRIKNLIRSEGSDYRINQDALFLINKATVQFLEQLAEDGFACFLEEKRKKSSLSYEHLSSAVHKSRRYEFLEDFVPQKVKAADALKDNPLVET
ncbi:hypothetical protein AMTRI_Chr12g275480 [Amborella trichopoda]|uniref:DNA polymerase epsilon subunit C n=1 Tax=Amborella trichopoda TaxID=13333 RepID=UPI0005D427E5|nr:DNA polymerase epsilon subunit C [Amborella trichopoda]|eukprot:XP_011623903.1 DNA polymerase epsilon subunit C [Amborella trichopoda]